MKGSENSITHFGEVHLNSSLKGILYAEGQNTTTVWPGKS